MVERLEKRRKVDAEHPSHDEREGQNDGCEINCEAGVVEEGVEHNAQALTTAYETESIERLYEECGCISWQSCSQVDENGEKEARHDLEWNFKQCVLKEKGFHGVYPITVVAIKDL